ncbi:MAG: DegT/DnrJ/EryC1/StrS family aminotransferase [Nitrospiraceae bacterium]|nr:DegT/DnrJ/EryC1/StrS family aminotransferase [Nitrospiraceae bacterium]
MRALPFADTLYYDMKTAEQEKNTGMKIPMLDLKLEYGYLKDDIDSALSGCLARQEWILGPEVKELESRVAEYIGVRHAVGLSSGTDALAIGLRAMAIKLRGKEYFGRADKIVTTAFAATATGGAILRSGATPVFMDIDPYTFNMDSDKLRAYLQVNSSGVAGVMAVHLYGNPCDMDAVMQLAGEYELFVLEDAAQAFGGSFYDRKLGSIGNLGAFSFSASGNLAGFGDAGMLTTNDDEAAELARMLRRHGARDKYNVEHIGYNARMDTIQAAVLLAKLRRIDEMNEGRRFVAAEYTNGLAGIQELDLPYQMAGAHRVFHQYAVRVKGPQRDGARDDLQKFLAGKGVATSVFYPVPLHKMKAFHGRCELPFRLDESEQAVKEVLCLPIGPFMKVEDVRYITGAVREFFPGR